MARKLRVEYPGATERGSTRPTQPTASAKAGGENMRICGTHPFTVATTAVVFFCLCWMIPEASVGAETNSKVVRVVLKRNQTAETSFMRYEATNLVGLASMQNAVKSKWLALSNSDVVIVKTGNTVPAEAERFMKSLRRPALFRCRQYSASGFAVGCRRALEMRPLPNLGTIARRITS